MMTGSGDDDDLERAFAAGATDFFTKPVAVPHLLARLRAVLRLHDELDWYRNRVRMLEEQARYQEAALLTVKSEAGLDGLTGLANRRTFDQVLDREWARAAREAAPLALVMIDVDHFKAYNDLYGHPAGDYCLSRVAAVLRETLNRPGDVAARYGGEEFSILLPQTGTSEARVIAERIRRRIERTHFPHDKSQPLGAVTVSIGISSFGPDLDSPVEIVYAADQALYVAKSLGKNCVEAFEPKRPKGEGAKGEGSKVVEPKGEGPEGKKKGRS
jgi:diguanylate cyclase (GGDEF)-like protein